MLAYFDFPWANNSNPSVENPTVTDTRRLLCFTMLLSQLTLLTISDGPDWLNYIESDGKEPRKLN